MTDAAPTEATPKTDSRLRQLVDFGGLLAFGAAFLVMRLRGLSGDEALVHATWFLVAGSAVGVAVGLIVEKRLALMPLLVGGFALVFGLLTVLTGDGLWVKVKVTALNLSLAVALSGGIFLGKQPLKARLGTVIPQLHRIRGYGDFLHYHLLATGRIDAVVESDVNILDIAALTVIVREAGGVFTDLSGAPVGLATTSVMAATPALHAPVIELLGF